MAKVVAIALVLAETILVLPVNLTFMLIVFILPWIVIACILYFKGMLKLYKGKRDANPAAGMALWVTAAIIVTNTLMNYNLYYFTGRNILLLIVITAIIAAIWLICCKGVILSEARRKNWLVAGIILSALAYSYGLLIYSNCYGVRSVADIHRVEITFKHIDLGSRYKSYLLTLTPWSDDYTTKTVKVSEAYFEKVKDGDSLTVHIWKGRWDIPWYRIDY